MPQPLDLNAKERKAQTRDEGALFAEEKRRLGRHQDELKRLLKGALLLLQDQIGVPVFKTDSGPLYEVLTRIRTLTGYGLTVRALSSA